MQCENFETRLNQLLDRRLRPETDDHLRAHAQVCEACGELLAAQEFLFDGAELLECPEPSPGFAQRVVSSLKENTEPMLTARSARPGTFHLPRWLAVAASIAAVLFVAVVAAPWLISTARNMAWQPAREPVALPPSALVKTNPGNLRPDSPTRPAAGPGFMLGQFPNGFPEVPPGAMEQVEQIPGGLRPIATSFGVAVGLIRNTLPRVKDEPPQPKPQAALPRAINAERLV